MSILEFGDVLAVSKTGKHVRVQLLPKYDKSDSGHWMPYIFPFAGRDAQVGGMPIVGSRVIVINIDNRSEDKGENKFAFGGLFDSGKNTAPETASDSSDDKFHWMIKPPNGGSIEFYDANGTHKIKISASNDLNIEVEDHTELVCNDIKMGTIASVKKLVNEDHLTKFNAFIDFLGTVFAPLSAVADPISAVTALVAMNAIWQAGNASTKDTTNKTSEFQAS